jgi:hypothetical protein
MKKHESIKSLQSQTSAEDDWSMQDDLPSPKRNPINLGWTADDFALIKGNHACSLLIANHNNKNRSSASSIPRLGSLPPSLSTTPRDPDSSVLGAPAMDAEGI